MRLRSLLGARGIQVVTTREADQSLDPDRARRDRQPRRARRRASACTWRRRARGVHLFASSLAPATPTRFMPWKTAQSGWVTRSLALAGVLNSALSARGHDA